MAIDITDTIKRLENRDITRRDLGKALAATGFTLATIPFWSRPVSAAGDQAVYFTWAGFDVPEAFPDYVAKHGATPDLPTYGSAEEAFTKLSTGFKVDVVMPCSSDVPRWRSAGLVQAIDTSRLSNWADVIPTLKSLEGTVVDGRNWFVPWEWGHTSVTYRTDLFDLAGKEESWGMLWDERYSGRLSILDAAEDAFWCSAIYGGVDVDNLTDEAIAKVFALMKQQRSLLRFRQSDSTSLVQALASGEVVAAMTWNDVAFTLNSEKVPVKFARTKEKNLSWVCGMVMAKDAQHSDRAYDLLDAVLAKASGEWLIESSSYGHSNLTSFAKFSDEDLAARGLARNAVEVINGGVFIKPQAQEITQKINRAWGELVAE